MAAVYFLLPVTGAKRHSCQPDVSNSSDPRLLTLQKKSSCLRSQNRTRDLSITIAITVERDN